MPEVMLSGPEGRIEARYHPGKKGGPIALILHPNPAQGGTMHNKVAYELYRTFAQMGFGVMRFNFRGVGRSQGSFSDGDGELNDASACLNWLHAQNFDPSSCWVAGFSFGAWVGMHLLMRRPEITNFVAVSPPANLYDFGFLAPCPAPGLIIQGGQDVIVPKESVVQLANRLSRQKSADIELQMIRGAGHFFEENLEDVSKLVKNYVTGMTQPKKTR